MVWLADVRRAEEGGRVGTDAAAAWRGDDGVPLQPGVAMWEDGGCGLAARWAYS